MYACSDVAVLEPAWVRLQVKDLTCPGTKLRISNLTTWVKVEIRPWMELAWSRKSKTSVPLQRRWCWGLRSILALEWTWRAFLCQEGQCHMHLALLGFCTGLASVAQTGDKLAGLEDSLNLPLLSVQGSFSYLSVIIQAPCREILTLTSLST